MKNIYYLLLPLILISCSKNEVEVGVKDLNYRNGLYYEINASQPFNGIFTSVWTSGSRNGGTSKVLIKNGVCVCELLWLLVTSCVTVDYVVSIETLLGESRSGARRR